MYGGSALTCVQFYDLEELFRTGGQIPDTSYIFMVGNGALVMQFACTRYATALRLPSWKHLTLTLLSLLNNPMCETAN